MELQRAFVLCPGNIPLKKNILKAAIHDIRVPVSEYRSLLELSDALFERGDYAEASRYIQVVMGDAIEGNWNSRIQLSAASRSSKRP